MIAPRSSGGVRPQPRAGSPSLAVHVDLVTGRMTVTGQLDRRTSHLLCDGVSTLLQGGGSSWTIDISGLAVADHAGLRAIVGAYQRALRHDRRIILLGASPAVRHALTRLRLDRHLLPGDRVPAAANTGTG
jgi:anti-anti-sigma factor